MGISLYHIEFVRSAKKEFDSLPSRIQTKVLDALAVLQQNPFTELLQIRKLRGSAQLFRVRLGDYRLLYEIRDDVLVIVVIRIGHRKDVYR